MCGRYYRKFDKQKIAERLRTANDIASLVMADADYNVAPTTFQPVIREAKDTTDRELVLMRWGLIPNFAKSIKDFSFSTFNAKAETLTSKATWRIPFERRRCLVPASGFYEWKKIDPKTKQPYRFELANGNPLAFAGLWDAWKDPEHGRWLQSFTIITTFPNELTGTVHDRMPVILAERDWDRWLSRAESDPGRLPIDLLRPYPAEDMEAFKAHQDVGNVRNNSIDLLNSA
jgi:putative SOS response-associated peptidase YedK